MAFINFPYEVTVDVETEVEVTVTDADGNDMAIAAEGGSDGTLDISLERCMGIDPDDIDFYASVSNTPSGVHSDDVMLDSSGEMNDEGDAHVVIELTEWANEALGSFAESNKAIEAAFNAIKEVPAIKALIERDNIYQINEAVKAARTESGKEAKSQVPQYWLDFCNADSTKRPAFDYHKKALLDSMSFPDETGATHIYRSAAALASMNVDSYCSRRIDSERLHSLLNTFNSFLYGTANGKRESGLLTAITEEEIAATPSPKHMEAVMIEEESIYAAVMLLRGAAIAQEWIDAARPEAVITAIRRVDARHIA